jgi:hypothetical protein
MAEFEPGSSALEADAITITPQAYLFFYIVVLCFRTQCQKTFQFGIFYELIFQLIFSQKAEL